MDRFLLAENPMKEPQDERLFILHTIEPAMIIEVHHEAFAVGDGKMFLTANYQNPEGTIETITLTVAALLICEPNVTPELKEKVNKVLSRAWRWYRSYLEWEDNQMPE